MVPEAANDGQEDPYCHRVMSSAKVESREELKGRLHVVSLLHQVRRHPNARYS